VTVVNIARCPVHGLHGCRDVCFAFEHEGERDCDGRVEQVPMVQWDHASSAMVRLHEILVEAGRDIGTFAEFEEQWLCAMASTTPDLGDLAAVPDAPPSS